MAQEQTENYRVKLHQLDSAGYNNITALTYGGIGPSNTRTKTSTFACNDGNTYWPKSSAVQGLSAELISGRLAQAVGAGPVAAIITVPPQALPESGEVNHLEGVVCGALDVPGTVNSKDLSKYLSDGRFDPTNLDSVSRARTIVFQTWLAVTDSQVLIGLTDGRLHSIDHEECFGSIESADFGSVVETPIPGAPSDYGKVRSHIMSAVDSVEALTDEDILEIVSKMPDESAWNGSFERRLNIAIWLITRRDHLREVMERRLSA